MVLDPIWSEVEIKEGGGYSGESIYSKVPERATGTAQSEGSTGREESLSVDYRTPTSSYEENTGLIYFVQEGGLRL